MSIFLTSSSQEYGSFFYQRALFLLLLYVTHFTLLICTAGLHSDRFQMSYVLQLATESISGKDK